MKEIASAIQEGAQAYLNRQYLTISVVGILIALILFYLMENPFVSCGFVIGAFLSGLAGYIGMFVSVRANVRTTEAATESLEKALDISFKSGATSITHKDQEDVYIIGAMGKTLYKVDDSEFIVEKVKNMNPKMWIK